MKIKFLNISGLKLLQILDEEIQYAIYTYRRFPNEDKIGLDKTIVIFTGGNWLSLAGSLKIGKKKQFSKVPCLIGFSNKGDTNTHYYIRITGSDENSERVQFPDLMGKQDLNYKQVIDRFRILFPDSGQDHLLAEDLMRRVMCVEPSIKNHSQQRLNFLDALLFLIFGVEASRNNATFATGLFMLDLIRKQKCYGRSGTKIFNFDIMFHSKHNYEWEDIDTSWYGGKFSMAVHGTESGNLARRYGMIKDQSEENFERMLKAPRTDAVPRRELSMMIHWLESVISPITQNVEVGEIKALIRNMLRQVYREGSYIFSKSLIKYSPRTDTGIHPDLSPYQFTNLNLKNYFVSTFKDVYVYAFLKDSIITPQSKYHASLNCKLISYQMLHSLNGYKTYRFPLSESKKYSLKKCAFCCKSPEVSYDLIGSTDWGFGKTEKW